MKNNMLRSQNYVIKFVAMFCAVIFAVSSFGTSHAFAAEVADHSMICEENEVGEETTARSALILDKWGTLSAGQQITGTFTFTKLTGTDFWAQVCAGSGNGYVRFSIEAEAADVPCGTCQTAFSGTGWRRGTYKYTITNYSNSSCDYSITIMQTN